jgi:hypothetical protein
MGSRLFAVREGSVSLFSTLKAFNKRRTAARAASPNSVTAQPNIDLEELEQRLLMSGDLAAIAAQLQGAQAAVTATSPQSSGIQTANASGGQATVTAQLDSGHRDASVVDSRGRTIDFHLTGNGTAQIAETNGAWQIHLTGTDIGTNLVIDPQGGAAAPISAVTADGALGGVAARGSDVVGSVDIQGPVQSIVVDGMHGATIHASQIPLLTVVHDMDHAAVTLDRPTGGETLTHYGLSALYVGGTMSGSTVSVASPAGDGSLAVFWVQGHFGSDNRISAETLPSTMLLGTQAVSIAGDPRFTTEPLATPAPPVVSDPGSMPVPPIVAGPGSEPSVPPPITTPAPPPTTNPAPPPVTSPPVSSPVVTGPVTPAMPASVWDATVQTWQQHMVQYGRQFGQEMQHLGNHIDQVDSTYYDAARVFAQIAAYTGDASWYQYADTAAHYYRDGSVLPLNGAEPGYWNFTQGLLMDYQRTGNPADRDAILALANNAAFAGALTPLSWTAGTDTSREVAYTLMSYINADKLGASHGARFGALVNQAIGHINQWFVTNSAPYIRPFMVGLTMQALIDAYQVSPDPRIQDAVKTALDGLWARTWVPSAQAFMYTDRVAADGSGGTEPAPDMNLLIAPAYAWLYKQTGDVTYLNRGDQVFAGGVQGAYLGDFKHFNQNYTWSFDYVAWRQDALGQSHV